SPSAPDLLMLLTAPPHTLLFVVSTAPAPTELYSLSLHDALPISHVDRVGVACQGQAFIEVGAGLVALDLAGFDPGVEESDLSGEDRKSTRLNSSHVSISYAVFCLKKKIIKKAEVTQKI